MHRFSTSLLGLGALGLAACGAPAELDESIFPAPGDTGYDDGSIGSPGGGAGSGLGGSSPGGGGSAPNLNNGGSNNVSQGGSTPLGMGGAQNAGGSAGSLGGGGSNAAGGGVSGGTGGSGNSGGCPDDITELFRRPGAQGGCEGGGCHVAGGTPPDLVSPNVEQRLVNVMAVGPSCVGRPYIGGANAILGDKISSDPPACGAAMPFLTPQALNAADEQCILDWIEEISGN